jgi:WD40 repeat protein
MNRIPLLLFAAVLTTAVTAKDKTAAPTVEFYSGQKDIKERALNSPDGKRTIHRDGTAVARVIDIKTGKPAGPELRHSKDYKVLCWAFSPDGKRVVTGAGRMHMSDKGLFDNEGEIRVWDLATGKLLAEHKKNIGSVRQVVFTDDSQDVRYKADRHELSGK